MFLAGFARMKLRAITAILVVSGASAGTAAILPQKATKPQDKPAAKSEKGPEKKPANPEKKPAKAKTVSPQERIDALSRASIWLAPPPIAKANFTADPKQLP